MPALARTIRHSALVTILLAACVANEDDHFVRGHKLRVASLTADARIAVYRAALGGAFDLHDPALTLLLDRRKLPRVGGMAWRPRHRCAGGGGFRILRRRTRRNDRVSHLTHPPTGGFPSIGTR